MADDGGGKDSVPRPLALAKASSGAGISLSRRRLPALTPSFGGGSCSSGNLGARGWTQQVGLLQAVRLTWRPRRASLWWLPTAKSGGPSPDPPVPPPDTASTPALPAFLHRRRHPGQIRRSMLCRPSSRSLSAIPCIHIAPARALVAPSCLPTTSPYRPRSSICTLCAAEQRCHRRLGLITRPGSRIPRACQPTPGLAPPPAPSNMPTHRPYVAPHLPF